MKIHNFLTLLFYIISTVGITAATLNVGVGQAYPSIRQASLIAKPGDTILVHSGTYAQYEYIENLKGTRSKPIYILANENQKAIYQGNTEAMHLSEVAYLVIRGFIFQGQTGNGVNIDDGGTFETPSHNIQIENCIFRDMNASGNNDLLKLSGLDSFTIISCIFLNGSKSTSGSGIDMVGCHNGLITKNHFENMGGNSIQAKGGSQFILIEKNFFKNGGERTVNLGGSTGLQFFRPIDAKFEAADLEVYANIFIESFAPIAFVGCVRVKVINNTIVNPINWVFRILQETVDPSRFPPCGQNEFTNNIIYFKNTLRTIVNIGPNTDPGSFTISNNLWFNHENPSFNQITLPVNEPGSIRALDPQFQNVISEDFNLKRTSPAISKGKTVILPKEDFGGSLFASNRSIGAYESKFITSSTFLEENKFYVYPNPTKEYFTIETKHTLDKSFVVNIHSMLGVKQTMQIELSPPTSKVTLHLPTGIYICQFINSNGSIIESRKLYVIE